MSWIDDIAGIRIVVNGVNTEFPQRSKLKFAGAGAQISDDPVGGQTLVTVAGALLPTSVKTSNYTAHAGELVLVDSSAAPVQVTLDNGAPVASQIGVKLVDGGDTTTVTASATIYGDQVVGDQELENVNASMVFVRGASGWYCISVVAGFAP